MYVDKNGYIATAWLNWLNERDLGPCPRCNGKRRPCRRCFNANYALYRLRYDRRYHERSKLESRFSMSRRFFRRRDHRGVF